MSRGPIIIMSATALAGCSTGPSTHAGVVHRASPSASSISSSSPTPSSPPTASRRSRAAAASGDNHRVQDVSFISDSTGWVLAADAVLRTTDGGRTWTRMGSAPPRVSNLRFASPAVGFTWRMEGSVWQTADGGKTWRRSGLTHVVALAAGVGTTWAMTGPLPGPHVWRTVTGETGWTNLGYGPNRSATLDVYGDTAYITGQQGAGPIPPALSIWTPHTGRRDEKLPCARHQVTPFSPLGVSTDGVVVLLCETDDTAALQHAYISRDEARTWTAIPGPIGPVIDVTATRAGVFGWNTTINFLHHGRWHPVLATHPATTFRTVGFTTDRVGIALPSDGRLYRTGDYGHTWQRITLKHSASDK